MKTFFKDIQDLAKTRKFWVSLLTALGVALAENLAQYEEFSPVIALLGAFGVYRVPNKL